MITNFASADAVRQRTETDACLVVEIRDLKCCALYRTGRVTPIAFVRLYRTKVRDKKKNPDKRKGPSIGSPGR
jgi:hypothetical protein